MPEIGAVSIKVTPDTTGFGAKVKAELEKIRDLTVDIRANLDIGKAQAELKARIAEMQATAGDIKIGVNVDQNQLAQAGKLAQGAVPNVGGGGIPGGGIGTAIAAAAALAAVGPGIAVVSTALAALPGIIGGIGIPLGFLVANMEKLKGLFSDLAPDVQKLNDAFVGGFGLSDAIGPLKDDLRGFFAALQEPVARLGTAMADAFGGFIRAITSGGGLESLKTLIGNISAGIAGMTPGITKITEGLLKMATAVTGKGMVEAFNKIADAFSNWINQPDTINNIQAALKGLLDVALSLGPQLADLFKSGLEAMKDPNLVTNIKNIATGLLSLVQAAASVGNALATATTFFTGFFNGLGLITTTLSSWFTSLGAAYNAAFASVKGAIESVVSTVQGALDSVVGFISGIPGQISGAFSGLATAAAAGLAGLVTSAVTAMAQFAGAIASGAANAVAAAANVGSQIVAGFQAIVGQMVAIGSAIVNGIAAGIRAGVGVVRAAVEGLANLIPGWARNLLGIHSPSTVMAEIGGFASQGLAEGIASKKGEVTDAVKGVGQAAIAEAGKFDIGKEMSGVGKQTLEAGFSFAKSNIDQLQSDLGIGGGAITAAGNAAWDWGTKAASNFIFNVSNVDEAISVKNNQQNKEAMQFSGR